MKLDIKIKNCVVIKKNKAVIHVDIPELSNVDQAYIYYWASLHEPDLVIRESILKKAEFIIESMTKRKKKKFF